MTDIAENRSNRFQADIIVLIIGIVAQTGAAVWWASGINTRVDQLERTIMAASTQGERIARLEEKVGQIATGIIDIKELLGKPR